MAMSLQEAKNRFSRVVDAAFAGTPQLVTRHGKPVVVVIAASEYERLRRIEKAAAPSFGRLLLTMPQDDGSFGDLSLQARNVDF